VILKRIHYYDLEGSLTSQQSRRICKHIWSRSRSIQGRGHRVVRNICDRHLCFSMMLKCQQFRGLANCHLLRNWSGGWHPSQQVWQKCSAIRCRKVCKDLLCCWKIISCSSCTNPWEGRLLRHLYNNLKRALEMFALHRHTLRYNTGSQHLHKLPSEFTHSSHMGQNSCDVKLTRRKTEKG
jgi:hypothetical protein